MSWLRRTLAHLALARPASALIRDAGGEPRVARGHQLDPRIQFLAANVKKRALPVEKWTVEYLRAGTADLSAIFGGPRVRDVRVQRIFIPGRSHSVPARLYLPTQRDNMTAMLVFYHWGGGVVGSPDSCHRLCALIAKASKAPVLSVDYRLAPEHKFPTGLEDALAAYQWGVENAARYGAPVGRAAAGGDSIGATFAAVIAQEMRGTKFAPLLQLLINPALDLVSETPSIHEFAHDFPLTAELADVFLKNYPPEGADLSDPRLSPGRARDLTGLAPALIYTAGFDMLLDQGEAYADRLTEAGVKVTRKRFDTLSHGFVAYPSVSPAAEDAIRQIARDTANALKIKA